MNKIFSSLPLSLYIHVPWCIKKCPYCDFNSHQSDGILPEDQYVDALIHDFQRSLPLLETRAITSIFIGGGTPSLLSAAAYERLFKALSQHISWDSGTEITLEANPSSIEQSRFADYKSIGINRLSIGVQSFQNDKLKRLGRVHDANQAHQAIETVVQVGFNSFNIDLMFGLPDQSEEQCLSDLRQAISYQSPHLSWYQLTIEPNTVFYKLPPVLPKDELIWTMEQAGQDLLLSHGYQSYEISAFCREQQQCAHNLNYWLFGDYLGIGAGAHSKLTDTQKGIVRRLQKPRQPKDYINDSKATASGNKVLSQHDIAFEFMLNSLRLKRSINMSVFTARTGLPISFIDKQLKQAVNLGLIQLQDEHFSVSQLGHRYLNDLQMLFLP